MTSGFVEPCLPSKAERPPSGPLWVHELKHDGYGLMVRRDGCHRGGTKKKTPFVGEPGAKFVVGLLLLLPAGLTIFYLKRSVLFGRERSPAFHPVPHGSR